MVEYKLWLRIIGLCFCIVGSFLWKVIFAMGMIFYFLLMVVLPILFIVEQLFMTG